MLMSNINNNINSTDVYDDDDRDDNRMSPIKQICFINFICIYVLLLYMFVCKVVKSS